MVIAMKTCNDKFSNSHSVVFSEIIDQMVLYSFL